MKFSEDTLNVLKNFVTINPSLVFKPGNVLTTMSVNKTILAKAIVTESFEKRFAIYELSKFLGVISLFDEPVLDFQENKVVFSQGRQKINYAYADESVLVAPPDKELTFPSEDVTIDLKVDQLNTVVKAINVLQLPELAFVGDGKEVFLQATNSKNKSSDTYSVAVGETNHEFTMYINAEKLKMMTKDYRVTITRAGMTRWDATNLTYWVMTESYSKFN